MTNGAYNTNMGILSNLLTKILPITQEKAAKIIIKMNQDISTMITTVNIAGGMIVITMNSHEYKFDIHPNIMRPWKRKILQDLIPQAIHQVEIQYIKDTNKLINETITKIASLIFDNSKTEPPKTIEESQNPEEIKELMKDVDNFLKKKEEPPEGSSTLH